MGDVVEFVKRDRERSFAFDQVCQILMLPAARVERKPVIFMTSTAGTIEFPYPKEWCDENPDTR